MTNIKLTIEYDGTDFAGWQVQRAANIINERTVQNEIEKALSKIFQQKINLIGASRTDAGVHACGQVANFHINYEVDTKKLLHSLNCLLPIDIVIKKVENVAPGFHSRFSAKSKVYQYRILNSRIPTVFKRQYYWHLPCLSRGKPINLDLKKIRREMRSIIKTNDFSLLAVGSNKRDNNQCQIKKIELQNSGSELIFTIEANRFLYKMVRRIISHLIQIGQNKKRVVPEVAPAQGLCLVKVRY